MKRLILYTVVLGLAWLLPSWAYALTQPSDCSYAQVNAAVASAVTADPIEVVQIPGGTCTWNTTLTVGAKSIVIQGAGAGTLAQCAVALQTTYTCIIMGSTLNTYAVAWGTIATGNPRITAMTFDNGTGTSPQDGNYGILYISGVSGSFRLDHTNVYTKRGSQSAFATHNYLRGVIDHNLFDCSAATGNSICFHIFHPLWGGGTTTCSSFPWNGCGDASWAAATGYGSSNWLFIEDNTIINKTSYPYCSDGWRGARYVWRYNIQTNCQVHLHGTDSAGRTRGGRAMELYGNTCNFSFSWNSCQLSRSGGVMSWGNTSTFSGCSQPTCTVQNITHQRLLSQQAGGQCTFWGCADDPTVNTFDQGAGTSNGYAAMDQIGRGQADLITGNTKTALTVAGVPNTQTWPNQALEPVYMWSNTANGVNALVAVTLGSTDYINEYRDYYQQRTVFDGTTTPGNSGVGIGTAAQKDAQSCTTGVAFWVTDEGTWNSSQGGNDGQLYKCTATNTWTLYYTPYTYPHPLVSTGEPEEPPPPQPTGLRLISTSNTNHVCLVWEPSTMENLTGYHVYHGLTTGVYTQIAVVTATSSAAAHKPTTQYCYTSLVAGTHYFSISAYNNLGVDTDLATEVSATFTALARATAAARGAR